MLDKKRREITLIEVGITGQDLLKTVETEKAHKYDLLAGELGMLHKCSVKIVPYVMTWDGIVTKHHRRHAATLGIPPNVESYIQTRVIKKTLEAVSFEARRSICDEDGHTGRAEAAVERMLEAMTAQTSGTATA